MERSPLQVRNTTNQDNIPKQITLKSQNLSSQSQSTLLKPSIATKSTPSAVMTTANHQDEEDMDLKYSKKRQPTTPLTPSRHSYSKVIKKPNNRPSIDNSIQSVSPGINNELLLLEPSPVVITSMNTNYIEENESPTIRNKTRVSTSGNLKFVHGNEDITQDLFNTIEFKLQKQLIINERETKRLRENLIFAALEREFT